MKFYNSLSQKKEIFSPIKKTHVSMYVCGITPYDTTHLGHAFVYNFFDVLKRYMEYKNYIVSYTQNVTDIDDDTLIRAKRDNVDWRDLGEYWTKKFVNDLKSLNINLPNNYVKATDHTDSMIKIIEQLIASKYAYIVNETIYFDVSNIADYGKLSKLNSQEMIALSKERGADPSDPQKKNPLDFILWQKQKEGEPFWNTPWGKGRPGWHIECSAMIYDTLGEMIDIHGGGGDLIFPHHESEIAQSESFTKKSPFVKYWIHVGMLYYKKEKMSKSLGNLILVSSLLKKFSSDDIRWLLLSHHYRDEWEYVESDIKNSQSSWLKISNSLKGKENGKIIDEIVKEFENYMDDDFNTPKVLDMIISLSRRIENGEKNLVFTLSKITSILGFTNF